MITSESSLVPILIIFWEIVNSLITSLKISSSLLKIKTPSGFNPSKISNFALAIFSLVPSSCRWLSPILVITAISGFAILVKVLISPKLSIPISKTTASSSKSISIIVLGSPISLFRFFAVLWTLNFSSKIDAKISFVPVLPFDPVIPITFAPVADR